MCQKTELQQLKEIEKKKDLLLRQNCMMVKETERERVRVCVREREPERKREIACVIQWCTRERECACVRE